MKSKLMSLKFWETALVASIVLSIVDYLFVLSVFYITIPSSFWLALSPAFLPYATRRRPCTAVCARVCLPIALFLETSF